MMRPMLKISLIACFMAMFLAGCAPVHGQETDGFAVTGFEATGKPFNAESAILQALENDETLSSFQKLRVRLALKYRPRVRAEILGEVTAMCIEQGLVSEDGMLMAPPTGQVDWDAIIEFIEKLIPLILKIIALF